MPVNHDTYFTNLRDLLGAFASSMNLISEDTQFHHEQTAYLSYQIASAMNLSDEHRILVIFTALLHDIGAISTQQVPTLDELEKDRFRIARIGAKMLRDLSVIRELADCVEFSQLSWNNLKSLHRLDRKIRYIPAIVHLSDMICTMIRSDIPILNQVSVFRNCVERLRGKEFPDAVADAFLDISSYEYVWMDLVCEPDYLKYFSGDIRRISVAETLELTRVMSRLIDFRSPFTVMHSAGVSASAAALAELMGMSDEQCMKMSIAGNLHDIGKLKVPRSILEKPGKLTDEEFNVIKEHPYYTRTILMKMEGFEEVADWAGLHHEKLNGKGYPYHYESPKLTLGCRIMAVADVFSAIAEERPYRKPMEREKILSILQGNADRGELSKTVVETLIKNYDYIDLKRDELSHEAGKRYFEMLKESEEQA